MSKIPIVILENHGGLSTDLKQGVKNSFAYSRHIDFRKRPTNLSLLPKTVKESSTTVTGLITEQIQLPSGLMVAIDDAGGVYTRSTGGTWTKNGTTLPDTAAGMVYNLQQDTIFIPGLHNMHSISNADGRFSGGTFTVNANAITRLTDQSATSSANTYTTTGSITETLVNKLSFTPTIEPLYSVKIWVTTKGTGDLVVTMHDAANNILGTKTLANASVTNGALNEFVFTTPVRTLASPNAATYHFHITHPSGTASTIGATTASDFSTARFETIVNRFVNPNNGWHSATNFLHYIAICNERYLALWEAISMSAPSKLEFVQHRLTFPTGYEGTSVCVWNEFLVIAIEKRSTSATNEFQQGYLVFWDGTSANPNFYVEVPEGSPYSVFSQKNIVYYIAAGALWGWKGGVPVKIFQLPNTDFEYTDTETYMVNNPHTLAVRNSVLLAGFPSVTNSALIEHGIYSYGSRDKNYDPGMGYSYTISTGNYTNGALKIGMIKSFGDKLFISWKDGANFGVDKVSPTSDPFPTGVWESLIIDNGRPDKTKEAVSLRITFEALPTGATITPKYKIDRGSWVTGTAAIAGATEILLNINKRYKEIQVGHDWVATTATPVLISSTLVVEGLPQEED